MDEESKTSIEEFERTLKKARAALDKSESLVKETEREKRRKISEDIMNAEEMEKKTQDTLDKLTNALEKSDYTTPVSTRPTISLDSAKASGGHAGKAYGTEENCKNTCNDDEVVDVFKIVRCIVQSQIEFDRRKHLAEAYGTMIKNETGKLVGGLYKTYVDDKEKIPEEQLNRIKTEFNKHKYPLERWGQKHTQCIKKLIFLVSTKYGKEMAENMKKIIIYCADFLERHIRSHPQAMKVFVDEFIHIVSIFVDKYPELESILDDFLHFKDKPVNFQKFIDLFRPIARRTLGLDTVHESSRSFIF